MSVDAPAGAPESFPFLRKNIEVFIAVLLGLVSIATAYATFQSSLYAGAMSQQYTVGSTLATEAESLYLEGNQQFVRDAQLFDRLTDLEIDAAGSDPALAAAAKDKYDVIYFQSVSEPLDAAIQWAAAENQANPSVYTNPLDSEEYQASLFTTYSETKDRATATVAKGDESNALGDKLTLATVILAIALFLLGIAAVVSAFRIKVIMGSIAIVIFVAAFIYTLTIPALPFV